MAGRPKNRESDMAEDPVFETVKDSQCMGCAYNKGLECEKFGWKPDEYSFALTTKKCPERMSK